MVQAIATSGIVSQAFRYMEMAPITSLEDDAEEAIAARDAYPDALDMMLERADWSFASVMVALPEVGALPPPDVPDPDLPHIFKRPADLAVLRQVGETRDLGLRWRKDRDWLRANRPGPLLIRYTSRVQNEDHLPALMRECVALQLAVLLMRRWVPTHTKHDALRRQLAEAVQEALHADARMASSEPYHPHAGGDWVREATT